MKKIIVSLALLAGACSPLINPAVKQTELQEQAQKQRKVQEQPAPVEQTAQPATTEGTNRQP